MPSKRSGPEEAGDADAQVPIPQNFLRTNRNLRLEAEYRKSQGDEIGAIEIAETRDRIATREGVTSSLCQHEVRHLSSED